MASKTCTRTHTYLSCLPTGVCIPLSLTIFWAVGNNSSGSPWQQNTMCTMFWNSLLLLASNCNFLWSPLIAQVSSSWIQLQGVVKSEKENKGFYELTGPMEKISPVTFLIHRIAKPALELSNELTGCRQSHSNLDSLKYFSFKLGREVNILVWNEQKSRHRNIRFKDIRIPQHLISFFAKISLNFSGTSALHPLNDAGTMYQKFFFVFRSLSFNDRVEIMKHQ